MKRIIALSIVLIMAVLFTACAKKAEPAGKETAAETVAETVAQNTPVETEAETDTEYEEVTEAIPEESPEERVSVSVWREIPVADSPALLHPDIKTTFEGGQAPDNRMIFELSYPLITLAQDEAEKYPELNTAILEDFDNYCIQTAQEDRERLEESFNPDMLNDEYFGTLTCKRTAEVLRADENFFSVRVDLVSYMGGAHGQSVRECFTYSTQDGSLITPKDVFVSKDALVTALKEKLEAIPDVEYFNLDEDLDSHDFENGRLADNIYYNMGLTGDGVIFYFNQYELAPYAAGEQIVLLSYNEYADIMNPVFSKTADSYVYPLNENAEYDTRSGKLVFSNGYDEYSTVRSAKIRLDGKDYEFETFTYHPKQYLVQAGDRTFIYAFEDADDDDDFIHVMEITKGEAKDCGKVEKRLYSVNEEAEIHTILDANCYARSDTVKAFTDPMEMVLQDGKIYYVGEDGMPAK
ncbi:MAG: DUF3298 domain-containing protein [Lachnospiraceae bacterium]|nr:DUF3298 domain-containing protein [Lachnospiraceae bacterium]